MNLKKYYQFSINESVTNKIEQFVKEISLQFVNDLKPVLEFSQNVNEILQNFEDDGWDYEFDTFGIPSDYEGQDKKYLLLNIDFSKDQIIFDEDEIFWDFTLKELEYFMFDIENKEITLFVEFLRTGKDWIGEKTSAIDIFRDRVLSMYPKIDYRASGGGKNWKAMMKFKISDLR